MDCVLSAIGLSRSVVLNLPTDMRGLDLEAIREWIRHKCDYVCRHKQTKLISGIRI